MKTWIKTPRGQRFALEDLVAYYAASETEVVLLLVGSDNFVSVELDPALAKDGEATVAPARAYLDLLDKALAGLGPADGTMEFARGMLNWALERERASASPGEAQIFRQCAAEVTLRLAGHTNRK